MKDRGQANFDKLFESIRSQDQIQEGLASARRLYLDTGKITEEDFKAIEAGDLSPKKKYMEWMAKQVAKEGKPLNSVIELAKEFHEVVENGKLNQVVPGRTDINQWAYEDLYSAVGQALQRKTRSEQAATKKEGFARSRGEAEAAPKVKAATGIAINRERKESDTPGRTAVLQSDYFKVTEEFTREALRDYEHEVEWCVSASDGGEPYCNYVLGDGQYFYVIRVLDDIYLPNRLDINKPFELDKWAEAYEAGSNDVYEFAKDGAYYAIQADGGRVANIWDSEDRTLSTKHVDIWMAMTGLEILPEQPDMQREDAEEIPPDYHHDDDEALANVYAENLRALRTNIIYTLNQLVEDGEKFTPLDDKPHYMLNVQHDDENFLEETFDQWVDSMLDVDASLDNWDEGFYEEGNSYEPPDIEIIDALYEIPDADAIVHFTFSPESIAAYFEMTDVADDYGLVKGQYKDAANKVFQFVEPFPEEGHRPPGFIKDGVDTSEKMEDKHLIELLQHLEIYPGDRASELGAILDDYEGDRKMFGYDEPNNAYVAGYGELLRDELVKILLGSEHAPQGLDRTTIMNMGWDELIAAAREADDNYQQSNKDKDKDKNWRQRKFSFAESIRRLRSMLQQLTD